MRCRLCSGALSTTMEQSATRSPASSITATPAAGDSPCHPLLHKGVWEAVKEKRKEESTWNLRIPFGMPAFARITALHTQSLGGLHTAQRQRSSTSSWEELLNREREMAKLNIILDNLGWILLKSSFSFTITCLVFFWFFGFYFNGSLQISLKCNKNHSASWT